MPYPQNHVAAVFFERLRSTSHFAAMDWRSIVCRDPCSYCGTRAKSRKRTREHIVPASCGGGKDWTNSAGACRLCQIGRGNVPLLYFLRARVLLHRHRVEHQGGPQKLHRIVMGELRP